MKKALLSSLLLFCVISFKSNAQQIVLNHCTSHEQLNRAISENPEIRAKVEANEQFTREWIKNHASYKSSSTITIPVVVHVLYNSSSQNISAAQIQSQIDVLNEDYRKSNSDFSSNVPSAFQSVATDVGIEFCLSSQDPDGNATDGITRTYTSSASFNPNSGYMKYDAYGGKDAWPTDEYLNLWVCVLSSNTLGFAQFPGSGSSATDGVVINTYAFGTMGSLYPTNQYGRTATHEVGHWLNLRHIWGDTYCGSDYVDDTPGQYTANYGCPNYPSKSNCSGNGYYGDMYMNFMDYSDDNCMGMFSSDQADRMLAQFTSGGYRYSLLNSDGCQAPGNTTNTNSSGYCSSKGSSTSYFWINKVQLNSLSNTSGNDGGYEDYTLYDTDLELGDSYTITLKPDFKSSKYNVNWKVWIDYNQDGDFSDSGEEVYDGGSASYSTETGTLTVSSSATTGETTMRVSMKYGGSPSYCETFSYGEVEDYTVNITSGNSSTDGCDDPSGLDATSITSSTATLEWNSVSGAISYNGRIKSQSASSWTDFVSTATSISVTALSASTTYDFEIQAECSGGSGNYTSSSFTTLGSTTTNSSDYCSMEGKSTGYEWIESVSFNTISNTSGNDGGYGDYTSQTTTVKAGSSYALKVEPGFDSKSYKEYWTMWIDYDQDGTFDNSDDLLATGNGSGTLSGTVTIPTTALSGNTTLRVIMNYGEYAYPCDEVSYGEIEDYTITISSSSLSDHTTGFNYILYPNPANDDYVNVQFVGDLNYTAIIAHLYDLQGKLIIEQQISHGTDALLNIKNLSNGIYYVNLTNGEKMRTEKLIVNK